MTVLARAVDLQAEIDSALKNLEKSCCEALRTIKRHKEWVNALERVLSQNGAAKDAGCADALDSAAEILSRFSDSMISKSKEAWQTYDELKHEFSVRALELSRLDDLYVQCRKLEQIAADLLCYSLGRLRRKES